MPLTESPPASSPLLGASASPVASPTVPDRRLLRLLEGIGFACLRLTVDLIALVAAVLVAAGGPSALLSGANRALLVLPPLAIVLFAARGMYSPRLRASRLDGAAPLVGSVTIAAMAAVVLRVYAIGAIGDGGEEAIAWLFAMAGVAVGRVTLVTAQRWARVRGLVYRPTLIVGAGVVGTQIARRLLIDPGYGLRPVGFIDDPSMGEVGAPEARSLPMLGAFTDLAEVSASVGARHVIIAFSGAARDSELRPLVGQCERLGLEVSLVPRMFESVNDRLAYETLGGLPLLGLRTVDPRGWQFAIKHAFDLVGSVLLLVACSPLIALIVLAVQLESPGPILFRQRRVGRDGQVFDLLKFRSMRVEAAPADFELPEGVAPGGVEGVDRRTRVGRFLRRTSLDELPQLVNVLRGEMSLIGPRPERPAYVELFSRDVRRYEDRHRVRSGVTGWAQVHGYRGQTSLSDRIEWDNYYIEHWSLGLDLKILLLTLVIVFCPSEA